MNKKDLEGLLGFLSILIGGATILRIYDEAVKQSRYICPRCKKELFRFQNPCPHCGLVIRWKYAE